MMRDAIRNKNSFFVSFIFCWLIAIIFLLLFPTSTSLLTPLYAYDTNIWRIIGIAWRHGDLVYETISDHKGPILFLIYALAYNKWLLFLFESLNLAAVLVALVKIGRLFLQYEWQIIVAIFIFLWLFIRTIAEGGQCEEWSLLPSVISLFLFLKYLKNRKNNGQLFHPYKYTFIYGLCFGFIAFIRLNNAFIICAILLVLCIIYIYNRWWKFLMINIGVCFVGIMVVLLPIIIYYANLGTLNEMIYSTFIYNFEYKESADVPFYNLGRLWSVHRPLSLLFITNLVAAMVFDIKSRIGVSLLSVIVCVFSVFYFPSWGTLSHYYTTFLPIAFLSIIYLLGINWNKYIIILGLFLWFVLPHFDENYDTSKYVVINRIPPLFGVRKSKDSNSKEIERVLNLIPIAERDSIGSYNNHDGLELWITAQTVPFGKYFFDGDYAIKLSPRSKKEIEDFYSNTRPLWFFGNPVDSFIAKVLEDYDLVYESDKNSGFNYRLWRRKIDID